MSKTALSSLALVLEILDGLITPHLNNEIKELEEKLSGNKFYLVILGLFKRGKSSFVNAILEEQIVPTGVIPLTAIITLIEYGEETSATIYFENGKTEKVKLSEVADFIAEAKNPNNEKNVSKVVIYSPNPILKKITLIDTPGVGSSLAHNTEATLRFVNKIDVALFILSTDIPITQLEVDFLKDLKKSVPKVVFVLNKSDLLPKEKLEELLNYNIKVLNEICDKDVKISPVSSIVAEEALANNNQNAFDRSGIPTVRKAILNEVDSEKEEILKETTATRIRNIITEGESLLKFKLTSLKMPANELDEKLTEFRSSIKIMKGEKDEFDILMEGKVKRLKEFVSDQVDLLGQTLNQNISDEIEKNQSEMISKLRECNLSEFQNEYFEKIKIEFNRLKQELEEESIEKFRQLLKKYGESSNSFLSEMIKGLTGLMNIKFDSLAEVFDLNVYTGFYYNFSSEAIPIGLNNKSIRAILPSFLIKKLILKKIEDNFTEKINGNCSSIKFDLSYKIQESFLKFKFDLNNKLESILSTLEKILKETIDEKSKTEEEIESDVEDLENRIIELKKLESTYFDQ